MITLEECPACGGAVNDARFVHRFMTAPPRDEPRLQTILVRCSRCGHVFSNPQPSWNELAPFYGGGSMYENHHGDKGFDFDKVERLIANKFDGSRFNHIPVIKGGRYLDVGSGDGLLVAGMARLGMESHGVEPRADAVAACRAVGLDVREGTLEEAQFPNDYFDCMSMNHVLEHVPAPVTLLHECRRVLKPGGEFVVGVPNYRSMLFGLVGWMWLGLDPPRHLHQFGEETLRLVAERAGLTVKAVVSESLPEFVEAELARWLRRWARAPMRLTLKTKVARPLASLLARRGNNSGRGEALVAYLTKTRTTGR